MEIYDTKYVYSATINAALGACFFGYVSSVLNPLQTYLKVNIYPTISEDLLTLMTSLVPAGAALGAIAAGSLALKYGRRQTMMLTDALSIVSIFLTLLRDEYFLLVGRLLSGFCVGLNSSLVPLYISEMSPIQIKGKTGTFTQIAVSIGILLSYILGLNVPTGIDRTESEWWRLMLGFPILLAATRSALLFTTFEHETPKFLILKNQEEDVKRVLAKIYYREHISEQLVLLRKERQSETQAGKVSYSEIFSSRYKRRLTVGCFLAVLQQFSGINAIIYYSTIIFSQGNQDHSRMPQFYTMIVGVLNLVSAFLATAFINKTGRKNLLQIGTAILFFSLLILSITGYALPDQSFLSKFFIFLYILGFGFSLGSVTWIYISEVLPDIGVGVAVLMSWLSCVLIAQGFPYLLRVFGQNGAFLLFAGFCFVGILFMMRRVKETKDRLPYEMACLFGEKKDDRDIEIRNLVQTKPGDFDI